LDGRRESKGGQEDDHEEQVPEALSHDGVVLGGAGPVAEETIAPSN
jgi:hypothetical protein